MNMNHLTNNNRTNLNAALRNIGRRGNRNLVARARMALRAHNNYNSNAGSVRMMPGLNSRSPMNRNKAAEQALKANPGQSIVFDATNATKARRAEYIEFARRHNLPVRCIHVATPIEVSMERNREREKPVPNIALYLYRKKFEQPTEDEGLEIIVV